MCVLREVYANTLRLTSHMGLISGLALVVAMRERKGKHRTH